MSRTIHFDLVSPEKKLVSEDVHMAVIPGDEGVFGVMAGHCSLVASLSPGVVKLYKDDKGTARKIFIAGGFADVTAAKCSILAEEAIPVEELDSPKLTQQLKDLREDLGLAKDKADQRRIKSQIKLVEAKISAASAA
ncbi:MAG: ATP synthase F1 subunit epsilon [Alphaproteobacteria bacterium]|nr:ATP synthase F1 subunit epsilon [Alphaproteobacteria bacterium]QQS56830.1 MAG: ATP synthase F1 subunit epsilon [Alphaproteobacteria bacterium]